jgi:hypothetical protein
MTMPIGSPKTVRFSFPAAKIPKFTGITSRSVPKTRLINQNTIKRRIAKGWIDGLRKKRMSFWANWSALQSFRSRQQRTFPVSQVENRQAKTASQSRL